MGNIETLMVYTNINAMAARRDVACNVSTRLNQMYFFKINVTRQTNANKQQINQKITNHLFFHHFVIDNLK